MSRYIDADALLDKACDGLQDGEVLYRIPPSLVDSMPTADVAPVVRCKDCIHYGEVGDCEVHEYDGRFSVSYFCADGERR